MTPEEESEYLRLKSIYEPDEQVRGFLPRLGAGLQNIPARIGAELSNVAGGIMGVGAPQDVKEGSEMYLEEAAREALPRKLDAPQGLGETAGDIVPLAAKEIALLLGPQAAFTKASKLAGLGRLSSSILGSAATGLLSGARQSGSEAAIQAGEFGAGQALAELIPGGNVPKMLLRAGTQAAVPLLGQAARGNNPLSVEGGVQAGTQAGMQLITDILTRGKAKPMLPRVEPPPPIRPGLAAELGIDVPASAVRAGETPAMSEEMLFDEVFGTQPKTTTTPTLSTPTPRPTTTVLSREPLSPEDVLRIRGYRRTDPLTYEDIFTEPLAADVDVFKGTRKRDIYVQPTKPADVESGLRTTPEMEGDVFQGVHRRMMPPPVQEAPFMSRAMENRPFNRPEYKPMMPYVAPKPTQGKTSNLIFENAQQNAQAETVHAPVQKQPGEGTGQVPAAEGGAGVRPSGPEGPAQTTEFVGTAINAPRGIVTGKSVGTSHAEMVGEAMDKGAPFDKTLEGMQGFAFKKQDGTVEWKDRVETGRILTESGQLKGLKPGTPVTSEHIRNEVEGVTFQEQPAPKAESPPVVEQPTPREMLPRDPQEALKASMADAKERLNAARAMGDAGDIAAIESEIKVIGRAMRQTAEGKTKIPLKKKDVTEGGKLFLPLGAPLRAAAGAGIGYALGDTDEERQRNAILFGGSALVGPTLAKKMLPSAKRAMEAAARNEVSAEPGRGRTMLGKMVRLAETKFNAGRTPETVLALEKGKGAVSQLGHEVEDVLRRNYPEFKQGMDDPASRAVGETFLESAGNRADVAALDSAPVPQGFKDALKAQKAAQIEAQLKLRKAESDPSKRALYASTLGKYQTRVYRIDADPKMWDMDEPTFNKVVDQFQNGPLKGVDRGVIAKTLKQGLAERRNGTDPFLSSGGNKIKQTLFSHRMDLTPEQWGFIDQMARDPRTPPGADRVLQQFFTDKSIDPAGQQFLRALAGNKKLSEVEKRMFREMADKQILTQEYRSLLGEITDPFERQMYTLNKLFGSVAQAQTISEVADMVLPSGLKMAMDHGELASKLIDPNFKQAAEGYVQLPDVPGFGKLGGKHVPRDVSDALTELNSEMPKWFRVIAKANNWVKSAATAYNPTVHIRQALQSPMFLMAARVGPWDVGSTLKGLSIALRGGDDMLMRELREQHITEANYGHQELRSAADRINSGKEKGLLSKIHAKVSSIYGIPDDFVRITAYLKHKPRYLQDALDQGLMGDAAERFARDKTTMFVNEHTMNYGQVAKAVKVLRNVPGVSPFASYSAELLRLTKNLAKDVATGSPSDKIWGAVGLGTLYALPAAIASYARSKYLTPEQQEVWDKTETLMPASDRSNLKIPFGTNKQGSFKFVNLNPMVPAGDMVSTVRNAIRGDLEAIGYSQPFFGVAKNPLLSAGVDIYTGEHGFTHEKLDEPSEKASRLAEAVLPSWAPPSGFMFKRAQKSLTRNDDGTLGQIDPRTGSEYTPRTLGLSMIGVGERVANPAMLQRSASFRLREEVEEAQNDLKRVLRSGAPERQKEEAQRKFELKLQKIEQKRSMLPVLE